MAKAGSKKSLKEVESQLKVVLEAPRYKMIPVDLQTHERFVELCRKHGRKQGAQVKAWVDGEFENMEKMRQSYKEKMEPKEPEPIEPEPINET